MPEPMFLTVTIPFGDYQRGDEITDPQVIAVLLVSHPGSVVRHPVVEQDQ